MKKIQKNRKGFTLIELLIVIAIIGILASVVLVSLSSARGKANVAAFKSEVTGAVGGLITQCDDGAVAAPAATANVTWTAGTDTCADGGGTFTMNAAAVKAAGFPAGVDCTGTVATESGASFPDTCN